METEAIKPKEYTSQKESTSRERNPNILHGYGIPYTTMVRVADLLPYQSSLLCGDCCITLSGIQSLLKAGLTGCHCLALGVYHIPPFPPPGNLDLTIGFQGLLYNLALDNHASPNMQESLVFRVFAIEAKNLQPNEWTP